MALLDVQVDTLANQAMNYLATGTSPRPLGNTHPSIVPYQAFETSDGYVILAIGNDGQFARFCEVAGVQGLATDDGGSWILPRQVGLSRAAEMAFTADPIDAETALAWGLVSQVTEPEDLRDAAMAMAHRIARNPPRQLRLTKRLMREGTVSTLDQVLELSAAYQGAVHQTQDHAEAVSALLERRAGRFSGA